MKSEHKKNIQLEAEDKYVHKNQGKYNSLAES